MLPSVHSHSVPPRGLSLEFLHRTAKRYCESSFVGCVVGILRLPLLIPTEPPICRATESPLERTTRPGNRPAMAIELRIGWLQVRPQSCTQCGHHLESDSEPRALSCISVSICSKLGGQVFLSRDGEQNQPFHTMGWVLVVSGLLTAALNFIRTACANS